MMSKFSILVSELTACYGGMEAVELQYCRELEKAGIRSDFIVRRQDITYLDKMPSGSRLLYIPEKVSNPAEYKRALRDVFSETSGYQVFWANHNQLTNIDFLRAATESGIPIRILHSHNAGMNGSFLRRAVHGLNRQSAVRLSNRHVACSKSAGNSCLAMVNLRCSQISLILTPYPLMRRRDELSERAWAMRAVSFMGLSDESRR